MGDRPRRGTPRAHWALLGVLAILMLLLLLLAGLVNGEVGKVRMTRPRMRSPGKSRPGFWMAVPFSTRLIPRRPAPEFLIGTSFSPSTMAHRFGPRKSWMSWPRET